METKSPIRRCRGGGRGAHCSRNKVMDEDGLDQGLRGIREMGCRNDNCRMLIVAFGTGTEKASFPESSRLTSKVRIYAHLDLRCGSNNWQSCFHTLASLFFGNRSGSSSVHNKSSHILSLTPITYHRVQQFWRFCWAFPVSFALQCREVAGRWPESCKLVSDHNQ